MQEIEEKIAHLIRAVEDMSEVIARQDTELMRLRRQVDMLIQREAAGGGGMVFGDERPPHY